jgi:hypothetical protein
MKPYEQEPDSELRAALERLALSTVVPAIDPTREEALLAAFDAARKHPITVAARAGYWWAAALATAASVLVAAALMAARDGPLHSVSRSPRQAQAHVPSREIRQVDSEFVLLPGASTLPSFESGTLVRMDVPVAVLPSLGVRPPAGRANTVRVDLIVGQDGLARAVRLVAD